MSVIIRVRQVMATMQREKKMLLFSTVLDIKEGFTKDAFIQLVLE